MLAEQRFEGILRIVEENGSVTVQQLMDLLDASESTIRRDLTALHNSGRLIKVHGGAVAKTSNFYAKDNDMASRQGLNVEEKKRIGQYAASLIQENEFVYMDAGTTTEYMIPYLNKKSVTYITNSISVAKQISKAGYKIYLIGGELKASTEAVVGAEAIDNIAKYNFTKGFFGTNGIHANHGLTTPDVNEAMVKKTALKRCRKAFVLADATKFNQIAPVTFAEFEEVKIITDALADDNYKVYKNIMEVDC